MKPYISLWNKPREVIRYLNQCPLSHFRLTVGLSLIYFVQIGAFLLSLEKITFAPLLSLNGLKLIIWFFLSIGIGSFVIIYASTLVIWFSAKCFNGQGTLPQTRAAVIWTLICSIPIGFLLVLIYFTFTHPSLGQLSLIMRWASYLGVFMTFIYGFIVMLKTVSETHKFGLWRAFCSIVLGFIILYGFAIVARPYFFKETL